MDLQDLPTSLAPRIENPLLAAVADRWPGPPISEVDRLTRIMIAVWEKVETKHPVTPSFVRSYYEMAAAVIADIEARTDLMYGAADDDDND